VQAGSTRSEAVVWRGLREGKNEKRRPTASEVVRREKRREVRKRKSRSAIPSAQHQAERYAKMSGRQCA